MFAYFTKPLGIKLPPYFDIVPLTKRQLFQQISAQVVNCVNSIGNGLYIEDESVVIRPKNGFGGIGGEYIKPTALANVHAFYQRLNPQIQIIGTGGVLTGRDAFDTSSVEQVWCRWERPSQRRSVLLTALPMN